MELTKPFEMESKTGDNQSPTFPLRICDYNQLLMKYLDYLLLTYELARKNNELKGDIKRLRRQCFRDGQTGLYNYRHFLQRLHMEFKRAKRYREPLTCIMLDVDSFKSINDTCGHRFGDYVLKKLGNLLRRPLRESDIVARYGGDEFGILVPNTGYQGATIIAHKIQMRINEYLFCSNGQSKNVTVSLGLASIPADKHILSPGQLIDFADKALYEVKRRGGNGILGFQEMEQQAEKVSSFKMIRR